VFEPRHIGEETADFQFRIHAGLQAAVGLQQQAVAENDHGVAALRAGRAQRQAAVILTGKIVETSGLVKADGTVRERQLSAFADGDDQRPAKRFVGECIGNCAHTRLLSHACELCALQGARALVVVFPGKRQR